MMNMQVADAVQTIVECCLPRFSGKDVGLYVPIDAQLSHYGETHETRYTVDIHLLFHRPSNYTKVFWHVVYDGFVPDYKIPEDGWVMESDHDSCWTSDGLSTPINKVWQTLKGKLQDIPANKLHEYVSFGLLGPKLHRVELTRVRTDSYCRQYKVKLGPTIGFKPVGVDK